MKLVKEQNKCCLQQSVNLFYVMFIHVEMCGDTTFMSHKKIGYNCQVTHVYIPITKAH